jgi:ferredoxin
MAGPTSRVDERDTMFARIARRPGTAEYEEYYSRYPSLKKTDDRIRRMPPLFRPGGRYYHHEITVEAKQFVVDIPDIEADPSDVKVWGERIRSSAEPTPPIKEMVSALGAVAVGCAPLDEGCIYSHKGRFDRDYGRGIDLDHPSVIVFLVEMDFEAMQQAPREEVIRESARQYNRAATISRTVVAVLEKLGYSAKEHYYTHYDVILPPLAVRAGLGELGRNNILIADRYGSRVRIGAVSTDMPLRYDSPVLLGADQFCAICKKCAVCCPSRALSVADKEEMLGVWKWPTDVERCYGYWRAVGTDCGICMTVCPFSHRDNWFHNLVRWIVRRAAWTHRLLLYFDDLIYGREWK